MAFISGNKIFDESPVTINTDHVLTVEPGFDGGTNVMLGGTGSGYAITISQEYDVVVHMLREATRPSKGW